MAEWQAEVSKLKVAQLDELFGKKGIVPRGLKAEKVLEVAWNHTREEIATWRRQCRPAEPPAMMVNRGSRQASLNEFFSSK